jgi:hypothetical protein
MAVRSATMTTISKLGAMCVGLSVFFWQPLESTSRKTVPPIAKAPISGEDLRGDCLELLPRI